MANGTPNETNQSTNQETPFSWLEEFSLNDNSSDADVSDVSDSDAVADASPDDAADDEPLFSSDDYLPDDDEDTDITDETDDDDDSWLDEEDKKLPDSKKSKEDETEDVEEAAKPDKEEKPDAKAKSDSPETQDDDELTDEEKAVLKKTGGKWNPKLLRKAFVESKTHKTIANPENSGEQVWTHIKKKFPKERTETLSIAAVADMAKSNHQTLINTVFHSSQENFIAMVEDGVATNLHIAAKAAGFDGKSHDDTKRALELGFKALESGGELSAMPKQVLQALETLVESEDFEHISVLYSDWADELRQKLEEAKEVQSKEASDNSKTDKTEKSDDSEKADDKKDDKLSPEEEKQYQEYKASVNRVWEQSDAQFDAGVESFADTDLAFRVSAKELKLAPDVAEAKEEAKDLFLWGQGNKLPSFRAGFFEWVEGKPKAQELLGELKDHTENLNTQGVKTTIAKLEAYVREYAGERAKHPKIVKAQAEIKRLIGKYKETRSAKSFTAGSHRNSDTNPKGKVTREQALDDFLEQQAFGE